MPPDCFQILELDPRASGPADVRERFLSRRRVLVDRLHCPDKGPAARAALDELHLAYRRYQLERSGVVAPQPARSPDPTESMKSMIRTCLEDGLLRHSRRQLLLTEGRKRGLSHFQTQLLIASTMIESDGTGGRRSTSDLVAVDEESTEGDVETRRVVARFAAAVLLALALLLTTVRAMG